MADDWSGFLAFAERLATDSTAGTAEFRSAISRAYYAAFHVLLDFAVRNDKTFTRTGEQVHRRLWEWFANRKNRVALRVATAGKAARDKRNNADYDDVFVRLSDEAEVAIKRARDLIKLATDPNL